MMFLGRKSEMNLLQDKYNSKVFEFGVIHGRRRVGKTTLLKEFIKNKKAIYFLSQQANKETNLDIFSKIFAKYKGFGAVRYKSFEALFTEIFKEDNLIVIIDEFTYLTAVDKSIESVLQGLIDNFKEESNIKLIISGSEVGMYENLFSVSKPLFGHHTFQKQVKECDYLESSLYYPKFTNMDKIRAYAIFGGLPYYLAQIDDNISLKENICRLIVEESSRFSNEVEMILNTELRSIQEYQSVLLAIASGGTKLSTIDSKSHINSTDKTSKYIKKLLSMEIIEKEYRFKDKPTSKKHIYRIKNNFIAFYYEFIWKNLSSRTIMDPHDFYNSFIHDNLEDFVSLRFESICQQFLIKNFKERNLEVLINIGRYWYNNRKEQKDIEIDVCVETKNCVYVYECKWTNDKIGEGIMNKLKDKGKELSATKYGAFSKSGYTNNISDLKYDLVSVDSMFKPTKSKVMKKENF